MVGELFSFPVRVVREGLAEIIVPDFDAYRRPDGVYEPAWAPVFYNPRMAFNRDVAVVFARAYARIAGVGRLVVVEPLAGSGVRAIRYALEAGARVYASDIDYDAVALARLNVERNKVSDRVVVERSEANTFMEKLKDEGVRPTLVDLDPFGSPVPFLEAALDLLRGRGVLAVTATDTAPLTGAHPAALRRRYDVVPGRTAWEKEQALRVLIGYIVRRAAARDYGVEVLLAYYADHYVRAYLALTRGARRAQRSLDQLAYGLWCPGCSYTGYTSAPMERCPLCHHPVEAVGPVYTGPLCLEKLVEEMAAMVREAEWLSDPRRLGVLLALLRSECAITRPYYRLDRLCSSLKVCMPRLDRVVGALTAVGYRASRTHFDPRGLKTDAPHTILERIVLELGFRSCSSSPSPRAG